MDAVLKKIIAVANQYGAGKAILFGSRARGDSTQKSDYDIAFVLPGMTGDTKNKILSGLEEIDTLYKIDAVFLESLDSDDALTKNIRKDGIILMDKFQTKLNNFQKALAALKEAVSDFDKTTLLSVRDGAIQRFEFTAELAWKTVREYLIDEGIAEINTPKSVMKAAFAANLVDDEDSWIQVLNDRNATSHIYDEDAADKIFDRIRSKHIELFQNLSDVLSDIR